MKLFGTVRLFKEEKILVGTHVKKIEKFDEITNHFLQVFTAQQIRLKGILTVSISQVSILSFVSNKLDT